MPRAVFWYNVYCYAFAAVNLGLFFFSLMLTVVHDRLPHDYMSSQMYFGFGMILMPLTLAVAAANIWLVKSKTLRDPWSFHLTNIVAGIGTCVLFPCALPLLIVWFHPEVRKFYGRDVSRP